MYGNQYNGEVQEHGGSSHRNNRWPQKRIIQNSKSWVFEKINNIKADEGKRERRWEREMEREQEEDEEQRERENKNVNKSPEWEEENHSLRREFSQ